MFPLYSKRQHSNCMSSIEITTNNLAPVNYEDLLEAIGQTLQQLTKSRKLEDRYVYARETHLSFDIDQVAERVALQFATEKISL